jgi:hypothetical protein
VSDKLPDKLKDDKEAQEILKRKEALEARIELAKLRLLAMGIKVDE